MFSVACVCLSVCNALTFETLDLECSFLYVGISSESSVCVHNSYVSYWVKVKVVGTTFFSWYCISAGVWQGGVLMC